MTDVEYDPDEHDADLAALDTVADRLADLEDVDLGAPDALLDAEMAQAMHAAALQEQSELSALNTGRYIGAFMRGVMEQGIDSEEASFITNNWMECQVYRRIDRENGV